MQESNQKSNDESNEASTPSDELDVDKGELLRDAVVFQFKLVVDGLRDFVLIPVSLVATVLSLVKPGASAGREFYEVVRFGKRTEHMINLFGAAERLGDDGTTDPVPDLDSLVDDVEAYVRREVQGERFEAARSRIERALRRRGGGSIDEPPGGPNDGS